MGMLGDDISLESARVIARTLFDLTMGFEASESRSLLDIGCGDGKVLKRLTELYPSGNFYGLSTKVAQARSNNPNAIIKEGRFQKLPFEDGLLDIVFGVDILDYAEEAEIPVIPIRTYKLQELLCNVHRVIKPGKHYIVVERFSIERNFSQNLGLFSRYFTEVGSGKVDDGWGRSFYVYQRKG